MCQPRTNSRAACSSGQRNILMSMGLKAILSSKHLMMPPVIGIFLLRSLSCCPGSFNPAFSALRCPVSSLLCPHSQLMILPPFSLRKEEPAQTFCRLPPSHPPICQHLQLYISPSQMLLFRSKAPLSFAWNYSSLLVTTLISAIYSQQSSQGDPLKLKSNYILSLLKTLLQISL